MATLGPEQVPLWLGTVGMLVGTLYFGACGWGVTNTTTT